MTEKELQKIRAGAVVRVIEKRGEKSQSVFEGLVISRKHGSEPGATFTVRKVIEGVAVEKTYPIHSPLIEVKIIKEGSAKRAKLYWTREASERKIRKRLKI